MVNKEKDLWLVLKRVFPTWSDSFIKEWIAECFNADVEQKKAAEQIEIELKERMEGGKDGR